MRAGLEVSHVRGTLAAYALIRLPELAPDDVPPGTEAWIASSGLSARASRRP